MLTCTTEGGSRRRCGAIVLPQYNEHTYVSKTYVYPQSVHYKGFHYTEGLLYSSGHEMRCVVLLLLFAPVFCRPASWIACGITMWLVTVCKTLCSD